MPSFDKQADPLGFMGFLNASARVTVMLPTDNWSSKIDWLEDELDRLGPGQFCVMLGDESKLTDVTAEFVVYTNDPHIIDHLTEIGGVVSARRAPVEREPIPEWLLRSGD